MITLSESTSQPDSPISATPGMGFRASIEPAYSTATSAYNSPILQTIGWGYAAEESISTPILIDPLPSEPVYDYPFVAPDETLRTLVVDMLLSFENTTASGGNWVLPVGITRLAKSSASCYSIRVEDGIGTPVFDSTLLNNPHYKHSIWGTNYELLYWESESVTVKMILRKTSQSSFVYVPQNRQQGELDVRAVYLYPRRVKSLRVGNQNSTSVAPQIVFNPGFNTTLSTVTQNGNRAVNSITVSALAGAGKGKQPAQCENQSRQLSSINTIQPTADGTIFFSSDACHALRGTSSLKLSNDCTPCCECEDISNVGRKLVELEQTAYCLGGKSDVLLERLKAEIVRLTESLNESTSTDANTSTAITGSTIEYDFHAYWLPFASFRFVFRNTTQRCFPNLDVKLSLTATASLYPGSLRKSAPTEKPFSDCYVIDEIPVNSAGSGSIRLIWDKPIAPGQQVYALGIVYFTSLTVASSVEFVQYTNDESEVIQLDVSGVPSYSYTFNSSDRLKYEDFTGHLTDAQIHKLEKEIRDICTEHNYDVVYRRNATNL